MHAAAVTHAAAHAHGPPALVACMQMKVITMAASVEGLRAASVNPSRLRSPSTNYRFAGECQTVDL